MTKFNIAQGIIFVFGAIVGSFLNVCIWRMPREESIVFPGSHCPACNHPIPWYENIPILSYLILGGKCRYCKARISMRYFIVELLTAGIFLLLLNHFKLTPAFWYYAILSGGLIVATFIDFEHQIIPDEITLGGLALGLLLAIVYHKVHIDHYLRGELLWLFDISHGFFSPGKTWLAGFKLSILDAFWGAIVGGGSIYLTGVLGSLAFRKEAMGGGDVKLMAMLGSFIGWKLVLLVFFLGAVLGLIGGLITLARNKSHVIPYGPYLSLAALIAIIWGERIISMFFYINQI